MSLYVPEKDTPMDGSYYGIECQSCGKQVRWGSDDWPVSVCYVAWDPETATAIPGCQYESLSGHDKIICRELIEFFNGAKLPLNDFDHVCVKE
mgnify:CR=1 FL=1